MEIKYKVVYHPDVIKKDLPKLDSSIKIRIQKAIKTKIMPKAELFGIPLQDALYGYRKLRVGDYRIVFMVKKQKVFIIAIEHRSTVYKNIESRLFDS